MMDFHYNVIEEQYKGQYELIYSDTDSFVYRFKCSDVWDDIVCPNKNWFGLSRTKRLYLKDTANEGVMGKFTDELSGSIFTEFLALSPKVYSYKYVGFIDDKFDKKLTDGNEHELTELNKKKLQCVSKVVV